MTTVILAEKPDQGIIYCRSLGQSFSKKEEKQAKAAGFVNLGISTLDNETIVTWGFGHLVQLFEPQDYDKKYKKWENRPVPFFPGTFKYKPIESSKKQFKLVAKLLKEANQIVIATDPDREGEAIAYLILEQAGIDLSKKKLKRFWCNSQEKEEVQQAFKQLRDAKETESFATEAKTRAIADWLIGMTLSPFYTLEAQKEKVNKLIIRAGRVQTVALSMIFNREKEIALFKSAKTFSLSHTGEKDGQSFIFKNKLEFATEEELSAFIESQNWQSSNEFTIREINKEEKRKVAPSLLNLSALQSKAKKELNFDFSKTKKIQQSLYTKGKTTYPRTSCKHITEGELKHLTENKEQYQNVLELDFKLTKIPTKAHVDGKKVLEHFAIIPTKDIPNKADLTEDEWSLYSLITKHTLMMFMEDYMYEQTKVIVEKDGVEYQVIGNTTLNEGWRQSTGKDESETNLPKFTEGEKLSLDVTIKEIITKSPSLFTESTFAGDGGALEKIEKYVNDPEKGKVLKETKGLGTPATRSDIIPSLIEHGYVDVQKKGKQEYLVTSNEGKAISLLVMGSLLSSPEMTAEWEGFLQEIGKGNADEMVFIEGIKGFINKEIDDFPERLKKQKAAVKKLTTVTF